MLIKIPLKSGEDTWLNPAFIVAVNHGTKIFVHTGADSFLMLTYETDLLPKDIAQLIYEASAPFLAHQLARDV